VIKNTGVTIVALATLLAGFVASCASSELPPIADASPSAAAEQAEAEDEPSGLTSSTGDPGPPTATIEPTATVVPEPVSPTITAEVDPTTTPVPVVVAVEPTVGVTVVQAAPDPPRILPAPGTYRGPTRLHIETDNEGSDIYYTLDGSSPTAQNGTKYDGPFDIYDDATVVAVYLNADGAATGRTVAVYSIEKPPLDAPLITLDDGVYIGDRAVEIKNNEPGSNLIYTLDGTVPSPTNGTIYTGPVAIGSSAPTTLTVISERRGFLSSESHSKTYRILGTLEESSGPIVLSGDDVLEITDTHFLHRGSITLSGNAKLIITDSVVEHVKDFAFEYEVKATENSEITVNNSGIGTTCTGSFNWAFFDNSRLTVDGMDPTLAQCNTWNFMSGSSVIDVRNWRTFSGTVCDQTSVEVRDSRDMEIELCMPWPTVMDVELPTEIDAYVFDPGPDSTMEFQLSMFSSTIDGWGINVGPGSDITIRNTPAVTVGVGIGFPSQNETMTAVGIRPGQWEDQSWDFGAGAKLRLVNTFTYGWELNAWGGNTMVIRDSDYSGSAVNGSDSHYIIDNTTAGQLVAFDSVDMIVTNSIITGDVVANDNRVITLIDSTVGDETGKHSGGNVYARGNGRVILRNTVVLGDQITQDNGEIIVE